ncbi:MAG: hypothetical protein ACIAQZ_01060 [Sedimentisphaeraceae bacterium JB056]
MIRLFIVLIATLLIQGCAVKPVQRIPFPVSEYNSLQKEGTGVVVGQAFLRTRGGDIKTAAGQDVFLNPITSYSKQWYNVAYKEKKPMTEPDPLYSDYIYTKVADADGRFTFKDVPPGDYYLTTNVLWEIPAGYSMVKQGGLVTKKITVTNGETVEIILTW